MPKLVRHVEYW